MQEEAVSSVREAGEQRLSLCMIVRNEGDFISACLKSVVDVVDEIIVVDTGSSDDTVEICRSYGAEVLEYTWADDFSAARNLSLGHATGDWILWLDADEELEKSDSQQLRAAIRSQDTDYFTVRLINFYGERPDLDESYQISHLRLFRNHQGVLFENKIHERLNIRDLTNIGNLPVRVYHYGYMSNVMRAKDKHKRNITLLNRELNTPNYSPWIHYHIASEYYNVCQLDDALQHLNFGLLKFVMSGLKPPSMCYRLKYLILCQLHRSADALSTIDKAIAIYPDYVDLHFIQGLLFMQQVKYSEAETAFAICTSLGEDKGEHLTLRGVGSFRAWYQRGVCFERMGRAVDAQTAYQTALQISPEFAPAKEALKTLQKP